MLSTLLRETDSLTIQRVIDKDDDHHPDSRELEDNIDFEDSLKVKDVLFRNAEADEKWQENRPKRNNFQRPSPAAMVPQRVHFSRPMVDDDDSLEDLNEKLSKQQQQQRMPITQHDRKKIVQSHHQLMDTSDEEPSWEVKDDSLKKLFGVYWESIRDKKRNRPSIDDSMEDLRQRQHKVQQLTRIGNKRPF